MLAATDVAVNTNIDGMLIVWFYFILICPILFSPFLLSEHSDAKLCDGYGKIDVVIFSFYIRTHTALGIFWTRYVFNIAVVCARLNQNQYQSQQVHPVNPVSPVNPVNPCCQSILYWLDVLSIKMRTKINLGVKGGGANVRVLR